jgi:hypothetical protein
MYSNTDKAVILNGVDLNIDVCFGSYQHIIDKNAYYVGDGSLSLVQMRSSIFVENISSALT